MEHKMHLAEDLLKRTKQFDHQALAAVYDMYSPGIYRYSLRMLADPVLAEDCVAETFNRFLQALRDNKGPDRHLQAYLYRIAHNLVMDRFRREPVVAELAEELVDPVQDIESQVDSHLHHERIRSALHLLTVDQRAVIVLKYLEELDNEQVAKILKKPVGAVKSLQHRALARLQTILEE